MATILDIASAMQEAIGNQTIEIYHLKGRIVAKDRVIDGLKGQFQTLKQESKSIINRAIKEIARLNQLVLKRRREPEVVETKPPSPKKSKYGETNWYTDGMHECDECEGCGLYSREGCAKEKEVPFQEM